MNKAKHLTKRERDALSLNEIKFITEMMCRYFEYNPLNNKGDWIAARKYQQKIKKQFEKENNFKMKWKGLIK